jgi:hypothetical protein
LWNSAQPARPKQGYAFPNADTQEKTKLFECTKIGQNSLLPLASFPYCRFFSPLLTLSPRFTLFLTLFHFLAEQLWKNSIFTIFTNSNFTDLTIVTFEDSDKKKEHPLHVHRFILSAFAPSFLLSLISSLFIDSTHGSNDELEKKKETENEKEKRKVYYTDYSTSVVKLFLV